MPHIELSSTLRASAETVWAHATSMRGVNEELAPWVRMTVPRRARGKSIADAPPGREAFASVLLAFGVVPFDVHHLTLESVDTGHFIEESWSWLNRRWRHERTVDPAGEGCVVTDRVTFDPRVARGAIVVMPIVRRLFEHRHRVLRARFGA
jgi:ligand-binding SRPBCC domain-containing protein